MKDFIVVSVIAVITVAVIIYLVRAKKRGEKCIGCPYAKQCSGGCNGGCNGGSDKETTNKK